MKKSAQGFTLIELLVVIAITAIIGVFTLSNYSSFGEDQNLKRGILDIQSLLRTAQTNATTNVKCDTQFGATWIVEVTNDKKTVNLKCAGPSPAPTPTVKTMQLTQNIEIKAVSGNDFSCPAIPFEVSFAPLSGAIGFGGSDCTEIDLMLKNTKTSALRDLIINKGGRIYAE